MGALLVPLRCTLRRGRPRKDVVPSANRDDWKANFLAFRGRPRQRLQLACGIIFHSVIPRSFQRSSIRGTWYCNKSDLLGRGYIVRDLQDHISQEFLKLMTKANRGRLQRPRCLHDGRDRS
jgi:hypothetical protein